MSVVDQEGEKRVAHRRHASRDVWKTLSRWADRDPSKWRLLSMLALSECADWSNRMLAQAFGVSEPRVTQLLAQAREQVPTAFEPCKKDLAAAESEATVSRQLPPLGK